MAGESVHVRLPEGMKEKILENVDEVKCRDLSHFIVVAIQEKLDRMGNSSDEIADLKSRLSRLEELVK